MSLLFHAAGDSGQTRPSFTLHLTSASPRSSETFDIDAIIAPATNNTFYMRIGGAGLPERHIDPGDILIAEFGREPVPGDLAVINRSGSFSVEVFSPPAGNVALLGKVEAVISGLVRKI